MKPTAYRTIVILIILTIVLSTAGLAAAQAPGRQPSSPLQAVNATDTTLDVCMNNEPPSLYLYTDSAYLWQRQISSAIYDGPIDTRSYGYQAVIFKSIPTLDNGGAVLDTVSVSAGDWIVNRDGDVVELAAGTWYWPADCFTDSCAAEYTSGDVDMNRLRVTHTLLDGLLWSDGTALTAGDMVYSFKLAADVDTPTSKYLVERTASYEALSDTEAQWVGLPGYIDSTYSLNAWSPLPEHLWSSYTAAELLTLDLSNRTPLGWGPYVIDEWVAGSHIAMHKNPNYFRAAEGLPRFDALVVHFGTELLGMLDGTCDVVISSTEDLGTLLSFDDDGFFEVDVTETSTWEHLDFDIQPADSYTGFAGVTDAFQDVRVRQAFAYCIDRQAIIDTLFYGYGQVPNAYITDTHPYYPADAVSYPYDPAEGQALLAAAGWVDTNANGIRDRGGYEFSLTLHTTTAALRYTVTSMIATQMAGCGVQVIPVHISPGELYADWPDGVLRGRQYDLSEFAWLTGPTPPCELYTSWQITSDSNPNGQNYTGYSNPVYDAACQKALESQAEADRATFYGEATKIFTQDLPVLPLFMRISYGMAAPHIIGFGLDPTDNTFWSVEELSVGVEATVPDTGGSLESLEDTTSYEFVADTFTEEVIVTHTPLSPVELPSTGDLTGTGHFYSLEATLEDVPVQPEEPYTVTIEYTDGELDNVIEETLALYYWDGDSWELEPTSEVNIDTNTLTATPDHFSYWAVLGEPSTMFIYLPVIVR